MDGGTLAGLWSLKPETVPSATFLEILATSGGKTGTIELYYDPARGMFAYGSRTHGTSGFFYFTLSGAILAAIQNKQYIE
ncbi:MAG TPA: hypothetical protein VKM55_16990 [Candidatus Lokiarchaeia archaeon]|nr:hypothetical protein [Candidatus Lokiarchaeia archaeon]